MHLPQAAPSTAKVAAPQKPEPEAKKETLAQKLKRENEEKKAREEKAKSEASTAEAQQDVDDAKAVPKSEIQQVEVSHVQISVEEKGEVSAEAATLTQSQEPGQKSSPEERIEGNDSQAKADTPQAVEQPTSHESKPAAETEKFPVRHV
jgi:hypothetical protein